MRVKVDATVNVPTVITETIEIDDTEYAEWLDGCAPSDGMLIEFLKAGTGSEFRSAQVAQAILDYDSTFRVQEIKP